MTSKVTSTGINTQYPIPGKNNSSQGFRDNFASIANNLDQASQELTDLQSKVVLKSALSDGTLSNDFAGTLVSNMLVNGTREVVNNLGSQLEGNVKIDVAKAPNHVGTCAGNVTLVFAKWSVAGTKSKVSVKLTITDPLTQIITLPSNVTSESLALIEGSNTTNYTITRPSNQSSITLDFESVDCGDTIIVTSPISSPKSSQLIFRTPSSAGLPGDQKGHVCFDSSYLYVCQGSYNATIDSKIANATADTTNKITLADVYNISANDPVIFSGTVFGGVTANVPYYVKTIDTPNNKITISSTRTAGTAGSTFTLTTASGSMTATFYTNASSIWTRTTLSTF